MENLRSNYGDSRVVPIIALNEFLLVPIQIDLDDRTVGLLQQQILEEIEKTRARAVIIDVRMVDIMDSYISYTISETAAMARLMGCRTVLCGLQPPVALTLAQMGVMLQDITIARDLEHALLLADSQSGVG
ncbi:STAS domain-containing protein [Neomoorella humiferrea]|uniref:RsbT antagonist protein RsbS n=1 Tax=Neomoorella humiferrea TaxID=676965 RepID=A0A2T0AXY0_9FIRM|nr:STAS domain-containing protein [Moorella humiferrea]PRR75751.1 RsbT antagonist protein RsbS [Moorella humiferrea]